jgi:hypothetical protein
MWGMDKLLNNFSNKRFFLKLFAGATTPNDLNMIPPLHTYNGFENEMCKIYIYIISRFVEISILRNSC